MRVTGLRRDRALGEQPGRPGPGVGASPALAGPRGSPRVLPRLCQSGQLPNGTELCSQRGAQKARGRLSESFSSTPETWIRSVIFKTRSLSEGTDISPFV